MSTIKKKLELQQYSCAKECIDDFHLMFNNCYTYNQEKDVSCRCRAVFSLCSLIQQ